MFLRINKPSDEIDFSFDGRSITAGVGETLATALLAAGVETFRESVVGGEPRAPYCLMGICFECLLTIDGIQNRQSCLIEVREGMVVSSQRGAREITGSTSS